MRHSDIRTTLNIYGDVVTDEMQQAHAKVVDLALSLMMVCSCRPLKIPQVTDFQASAEKVYYDVD